MGIKRTWVKGHRVIHIDGWQGVIIWVLMLAAAFGLGALVFG